MKLLVRANNAVLLNFVMTLLRDEGLEPIMFDQHASLVDGSPGVIPRRVMIADEDEPAARRLLTEAGLESELVPLKETP